MVNEQNQKQDGQIAMQNTEEKKQNKEKVLKIVFGILLGVLVFGLAGYLIVFLVTDNFGFKNYLSLKKDQKTEDLKANELENAQNENTNENINRVNENVNQSTDITANWLEFDLQGISFLYPEVLEQSRKVRQMDIAGERKYDFYDFGVFGIGVLKNDANLSLKHFVTEYFDQENLLILEDVKIGKDQKIDAFKVTVTDEFDQRYGILGIKYFFAAGNRVFAITPGQAFPTKEAEDYYTENNIKHMDALLENIQVKN